MANGKTELTTGLLLARRRSGLVDLLVKENPNDAAPSIFGAWVFGATEATTHSTTGVLAGQGATVSGSAAHIAKHATTGTLTGQGSAVSGSASRTRQHASTGVLDGQGATVSGSSGHNVPHPTSGVLEGQGSTVSGSSERFRTMSAVGDLVGQGSTIEGSAARSGVSVTHETSGSLVGDGASIVGFAGTYRDTVAGGGIGHGKKKLRWIERDGKILIFKTPEEVELFIEIENRNTEEPITETESITEIELVNVIKPVEVIDKVEIKQLSKAYGYQRKLYHADQVGNIERVIAIYRELQQREDDDVETILMAML